MMYSPRTVVLLSSHNGAGYLQTQFDSLFRQDTKPTQIMVRDDGSTDSTPGIIAAIAAHHPEVSLVKGSQLGVFLSFMDLLKNAGESFDYYSFCDQDDVWLPSKLSQAIAHLTPVPSHIPTMYFCRRSIVDHNLVRLFDSPHPKSISFNNALVENCAAGCTIVINRSLRNLLLHKLPKNLAFHDRWCYLVATAFGKVIYDNNSHILHRRHAATASQTVERPLEKTLKRLGMMAGGYDAYGLFRIQAKALLDAHGEQLQEQKRYLALTFSQLASKGVLTRLSNAWTLPLRRNNIIDEVVLRSIMTFSYRKTEI